MRHVWYLLLLVPSLHALPLRCSLGHINVSSRPPFSEIQHLTVDVQMHVVTPNMVFTLTLTSATPKSCKPQTPKLPKPFKFRALNRSTRKGLCAAVNRQALCSGTQHAGAGKQWTGPHESLPDDSGFGFAGLRDL